MTKQLFHTVEEHTFTDKLKNTLLLDELILYKDKGVKDIPLFCLTSPCAGFHPRDWNRPKDVSLHVLIGKEYKSYFIFIVTNKYGNTLSFALPMEDHSGSLPFPMMAGELRISFPSPSLHTKGDRKKNVCIIPLKGEVLEVYRYGLLLFMDKHGILNNKNSTEVLDRQEEKAEVEINFPTEEENNG